MTIKEQLHGSKTHKAGFDPNCPACLKKHGIDGVIRHLRECAIVNEEEAKEDAHARAVAGEQRRVIGILMAYRKATADAPHA